MARNAVIELRLQRWAEWRTNGSGEGYPSISVLHREWLPAVAGAAPVLRVYGVSEVAQTHQAIGQLSARLRDTIVVHYIIRGSVADQAAQLGCAQSTLHTRIDRAHAELQSILGSFCNMEELGYIPAT
jgi:DNA-directed RNA polymerase specialized sigma24 family protein